MVRKIGLNLELIFVPTFGSAKKRRWGVQLLAPLHPRMRLPGQSATFLNEELILGIKLYAHNQYSGAQYFVMDVVSSLLSLVEKYLMQL